MLKNGYLEAYNFSLTSSRTFRTPPKPPSKAPGWWSPTDLTTVDGFKKPLAPFLILLLMAEILHHFIVVYPMISKKNIPGGAGFLPSTVVRSKYSPPKNQHGTWNMMLGRLFFFLLFWSLFRGLVSSFGGVSTHAFLFLPSLLEAQKPVESTEK